MGDLLFGRIASTSQSAGILVARGAGQLNSPIVPMKQFTPNELKAMRAVAMVGASMSLLFGMMVMFWFFNMRRSFRHHLIMLLIISDSFKAVWQFIFPIVSLFMGGVKSTDSFCTATGFLLTVGVEASDFAVLMIAIHSALSIFRPRSGMPGRGGLYRFRYAIYVAWIIFPVTLGSLAFVNKNTPYSAQNTFCYLPVRPFWYRLALAWIPRYFIMLTITVLYVSIYVYVRWQFHSYSTNFGFSAVELDETDFSRERDEKRRSSLHSMIPRFRFGSSGSYNKEKRISIADVPFSGFARAFSFKEPLPGSSRGEAAGSSSVGPKDAEKWNVPTVSLPPPTYQPRLSGSPTLTVVPQSDGSGSARRSLESPSPPEDAVSESAARDRRRRQLAIQRQLRFLFIYPLVYVMIWIVPFVSNILQYSSSYVQHPSFPLNLFISITIPLQGFIDCALFTTREKPWRYMPVTDKQPWYSKILGLKWQPAHIAKFDVVGTTAESRRAYERRARERREHEQKAKDREEEKNNNRLSRKHSMSWWDSVEAATRVTSASDPTSPTEGPAHDRPESGMSGEFGGAGNDKPKNGSLRGKSAAALKNLRPILRRDKSSNDGEVPTMNEIREER